MSRRKQSKPQHVEKGSFQVETAIPWITKEIKVEFDDNWEAFAAKRSRSKSPDMSPALSAGQPVYLEDKSPSPETRSRVPTIILLKQEAEDSIAPPIPNSDSDNTRSPICALNSKRNDSANNHLGDSQNDSTAKSRAFHCQGCGVSFLQESTLKVHVKSYCSGKRYKFECSLCGAKFPDKKMWKLHEEVHAAAQSQSEASGNNIPKSSESTCREKLPHFSTACVEKNIRFPRSLPSKKSAKTPSRKRSAPALTSLSSSDISAHAARHSFPCEVRFSREDGPMLSVSPRPRNASPRQFFTCIVCDSKFFDVVNLQKHILLLHARLPDRAVAESLTSAVGCEDSFGAQPPYSSYQSPGRNAEDQTNGSSLGYVRPLPVEPLRDVKRCTTCNITFESADNLRAHKMHYCSTRNTNHWSLFRDRNSPVSDHGIGNSRASSEESDSGARPKKRKLSAPHNKTSGVEELPDSVDPFQTGLVTAKKMYDCKECNIQFSRPETYMAHKRHYCDNRRLNRSRQQPFASTTNKGHCTGLKNKQNDMQNVGLETAHDSQHTGRGKHAKKKEQIASKDACGRKSSSPFRPRVLLNSAERKFTDRAPANVNSAVKHEIYLSPAEEARGELPVFSPHGSPVDLSTGASKARQQFSKSLIDCSVKK